MWTNQDSKAQVRPRRPGDWPDLCPQLRDFAGWRLTTKKGPADGLRLAII